VAQVAEYNRQVQLRAQQAQRSTHQYIHSFLKHELYSAIPCSFVCCTVWPRECRGSVEPADSDLPDGGPEDDHVLTQAGMENLDHEALACPCIWMGSVVGGAWACSRTAEGVAAATLQQPTSRGCSGCNNWYSKGPINTAAAHRHGAHGTPCIVEKPLHVLYGSLGDVLGVPNCDGVWGGSTGEYVSVMSIGCWPKTFETRSLKALQCPDTHIASVQAQSPRLLHTR
jgi:hypothetical protein